MFSWTCFRSRARARGGSAILVVPVPATSHLKVILVALASGCAPGQAGADPPTPAAPPPAEPVAVTPAVEPAAVEPAEPATPSEPAAPVPFDPMTVTAIRARIVAIPNRKNWVPCGVHHSVGALAVEVLDAGEPPPRMLLFVSCPADLRRGPKLAVGATIAVTLHRRKQSWPAVAGLPADLPRRYVASFTETAG